MTKQNEEHILLIEIAEIIGSNHYGKGDWDRIKEGTFSSVTKKDAQWIYDTAKEVIEKTEAILKRDYISKEAHREEINLDHKDMIAQEYKIRELKESIKTDYISKKDVKDVLELVREVIVDAICCEDGLDGGTGEAAIKWCTDILDDQKEFEEYHKEATEYEGEPLLKALNQYISKQSIRDSWHDIWGIADEYIEDAADKNELSDRITNLLTGDK